ncbi:hypothetical protein CWE15_06465 [Aliidiomarina taiwanensis]|uniref:Prepilin-type cleavage/methylation domain-containing protein n=1 Tax=Aliidiomarina taiwanensis TaxID=946228 RepID=A0A432X892_9GAMM|nr:prepilin-type N-terminal cleavage/methylation domain-containing protein [Aliidiomarina taiwanensis]RUO43040.1 hypothetical protein CWE15_06465 [Aliidiomarina taiwanensis]
MRRHHLKWGAGFTLLELLMVIGLLTVFASISVNTWVQWRWRLQYGHSVSAVAAAVKQAQAFAQRHHQDYWLSVEPDCIWLATSSQGNCQHHGVYRAPPEISWQAQFTQGKQLRFMAGRGLSGFGAGSIRIQHHKFATHEAAVVVSSLGRVRLCESDRLLSGVPLC